MSKCCMSIMKTHSSHAIDYARMKHGVTNIENFNAQGEEIFRRKR
jgi:hypothetical protein